ncbi:unnamed protein product, partial [marine sediment metagenome]
YLRNLSVKDYLGVIKYMKRLEAENKKALRKAKRGRKR